MGMRRSDSKTASTAPQVRQLSAMLKVAKCCRSMRAQLASADRRLRHRRILRQAPHAGRDWHPAPSLRSCPARHAATPGRGQRLADVQAGDRAADDHALDLRGALEDREDRGLHASFHRSAACRGPRYQHGFSTGIPRAASPFTCAPPGGGGDRPAAAGAPARVGRAARVAAGDFPARRVAARRARRLRVHAAGQRERADHLRHLQHFAGARAARAARPRARHHHDRRRVRPVRGRHLCRGRDDRRTGRPVVARPRDARGGARCASRPCR
jgi:hypothetical protein